MLQKTRRCKMITDDNLTAGICGTAISAAGVGLSVNELQAIISMTVTIVGFIISVLIPLGVKLINKIKAAKKDGKIDKEEMKDIISTGKEIVDETKKVVEEIKDKNAGDK